MIKAYNYYFNQGGLNSLYSRWTQKSYINANCNLGGLKICILGLKICILGGLTTSIFLITFNRYNYKCNQGRLKYLYS